MTEIDPFRVLALAIHPQWASIVYAGTWESGSRGRVFESADAGRTWSEVGPGLCPGPVSSLAVDPVATDTLYLAGRDGVFKRRAGDEGWTAAGLSESVDTLAIDPRGTLHAGGWTTEDGGTTWIDARHGPWEALAIDPADTRTIYAASDSAEIVRSSDGGATWIRCAALPLQEWQDPYDWGWVGGLAFDPMLGAVYASGGGGLFRTVDEGRSWTNVHPERVFSIATHVGPPATIYTGSNAVCRSTDGCETWRCSDVRGQVTS